MKIASQHRSRASHEAILSAADRLIEEMPFAQLSISDITKSAGVSVGCFYGRFESKSDLLAAMHSRYEDYRNAFLAEALCEENWRNAPLQERVRGIASSFISLMRTKRGLLRSFLLRYWAHPEEMTDVFRGSLGKHYEMAGALMLEAKDEITAKNPEEACRLAISIITGACRDIVVMKPADAVGAVDVSDEKLTDALTQAALGVLRS